MFCICIGTSFVGAFKVEVSPDDAVLLILAELASAKPSVRQRDADGR